MVKKIKLAKKKKGIIAFTIGASVIASVASWWTISSNGKKITTPTEVATQIVDGDTFVTKSGQMIRLANLDAPEAGLCGSSEAAQELMSLLAGQPLYQKIVFIDVYKRAVSLVYSPEGSINEAMLHSGWARFDSYSGPEKERLEEANRYAIKNNLGIYSEKCLSARPDKPECVIKGNIRNGRTLKTYTLPECSTYVQIKIQRDYGDRWFCTEAEAKEAGFIRSGSCHANVK